MPPYNKPFANTLLLAVKQRFKEKAEQNGVTVEAPGGGIQKLVPSLDSPEGNKESRPFNCTFKLKLTRQFSCGPPPTNAAV